MSRLLTAEELASTEELGLREDQEREIPKVPLPGRYYRYRLEVIEAVERGECTRTTQPEEVA